MRYRYHWRSNPLQAAQQASRWLLTAVSTAVLVVTAAAAAAPSAHADTARIEATGESADTTEAGRTRALDSAFAAAVDQALSELVTADARRRHQRQLGTRVLRHARRYIGSYKVLEESQTNARLRLRVAATVDLDKLREALVEMGVAEEDTGKARPRPQVVVLLQAALGDGTVATFGPDAGDGGAAGHALVRSLREHGFELLLPAAGLVEDARGADSAAPAGALSDDAAAALARRTGASGAFVIAIAARPSGSIRATQLLGAAARASVRVLDVSAGGPPRRVASASVDSAGFAGQLAGALEVAAAQAAAHAVQAVAEPVAAYWPPASAAESAMMVEIRGYRGWQAVGAIVDLLAATRGIERVWPRRLGKQGVALAVVTGQGRRRVASILQRAELADGRLSVKVRGAGGLVVEIVDDGAGEGTGGRSP